MFKDIFLYIDLSSIDFAYKTMKCDAKYCVVFLYRKAYIVRHIGL